MSQVLITSLSTVGELITSLSTNIFFWTAIGLLATGWYSYKIAKSLWVESLPNQWLLIIRNGKLRQAGVGLKTFIGPYDNVVRFPSKVERISFSANNVTKQMQGVQINGFAFWSVYRDQDGPFRCYKYMEGGDANKNVQAMCQSALRNLIANSNLDEVLRNRSHLRDNMKTDLKDQFKGWGVWLESVEITEVTICSTRLFTDLQAEFRQDTRLKAERINIETNQRMQEAKNGSDVKLAQMNQTNDTKRQQTKNDQEIKRRRQTAQFEEKKNQMEINRLEREKKLEIARLKNQLEKAQESLSNQQKLMDTKLAFELDTMRKKLEVDRLHDDKTLQKYQIDSMERIYNKLGIKEVRINQFVGDSKSTLASILPTLGFGAAQMRSAE